MLPIKPARAELFSVPNVDDAATADDGSKLSVADGDGVVP
jgi:hypothetical protein